MTLEECYSRMGGNYEEVLGRLCNRAFVEKFLLKFLNDDSYQTLQAGLQSGDLTEAFRAAHMLKGVCQNLGLGKLYESDRVVTDALRDGKNEVTGEMIRQLDADYKLVISCIQEYQQSAE